MVISTETTVKTNKPCIFTISFELLTLFQKLVQKAVKKRTTNIKVYHIIPLNDRLLDIQRKIDNYLFFCGMVDQRKVFSLISSRDHCQRSSPSRTSDTPRAGFKPAQNLASGFFRLCNSDNHYTTSPFSNLVLDITES